MYSAKINGGSNDTMSISHSSHKAIMSEAAKSKKSFVQKKGYKK